MGSTPLVINHSLLIRGWHSISVATRSLTFSPAQSVFRTIKGWELATWKGQEPWSKAFLGSWSDFHGDLPRSGVSTHKIRDPGGPHELDLHLAVWPYISLVAVCEARDRHRLWRLVLLHLVEAIELLTTACVQVCSTIVPTSSQEQISNRSQLSRTSHSSAKRCEVKAAQQPVEKWDYCFKVKVFHDMNSDPMWWFPKIGVPRIIHFSRISLLNHPLFGVSPFIWKTQCGSCSYPILSQATRQAPLPLITWWTASSPWR